MRLQGLREPPRPRTEERLRLVLVGEPREDGADEPGAQRVELQPVVVHRAQEAAPAGQRRVRHQPDDRVLPVDPQQRLQRRHRVARRRLLPREARRLRGLRGAAQLRRGHEPRHQVVIIYFVRRLYLLGLPIPTEQRRVLLFCT